MTDSPVQRARLLIAEAAQLDRLSPSERSAGKILLHPRLVQCLLDLREYHEGHAQEHRQLVKLVEQLLSSIAVTPPEGSPAWWQEIPPRTGSAFRMSIRRLVEWLKGDS